MDFLQELPDEVFLDILLRMPYEHQLKFKQLSEPAKEIIESSQFYNDRVKSGLSNKYVCLAEADEISIYDPARRTCILKASLPTAFQASWGTQIISVNNKIVLLNLQYNDNSSAMTLTYDLLSNSWKQAAECPNLRSDRDFACCASPEGSIYTAGGLHTLQHAVLCEAAVYKVDEDKWEILPNMHRRMGLSSGVFMDGMFYVIGVPREGTQRYDPNTGLWTTIDNMSLQTHQDALYAFGRLIAFRRGVVDEYDWEGNVWKQFDRIPEDIDFDLATVWCDGIFFYRNFPRPIFYLYKPTAALSDMWTPINVYYPAIEIMCMTTIEI